MIMTESKSVIHIFQSKMVPAPSWNARDFFLQFNFTMAHILDKMNTAADIVFRLESDTNERTILKITEDVPAQTMDINIESAAKAQNGQNFFHIDDLELPSEEQLW